MKRVQLKQLHYVKQWKHKSAADIVAVELP